MSYHKIVCYVKPIRPRCITKSEILSYCSHLLPENKYYKTSIHVSKKLELSTGIRRYKVNYAMCTRIYRQRWLHNFSQLHLALEQTNVSRFAVKMFRTVQGIFYGRTNAAIVEVSAVSSGQQKKTILLFQRWKQECTSIGNTELFLSFVLLPRGLVNHFWQCSI